jgi:hypothetical protein
VIAIATTVILIALSGLLLFFYLTGKP